MKQKYQEKLKVFLRTQIIKTVNERNLTIDKAANILDIDPRSFSYLKSGKTMCSTATLIIYLVKLCPDTEQFLTEAKKIIDEIEQTYDV